MYPVEQVGGVPPGAQPHQDIVYPRMYPVALPQFQNAANIAYNIPYQVSPQLSPTMMPHPVMAPYHVASSTVTTATDPPCSPCPSPEPCSSPSDDVGLDNAPTYDLPIDNYATQEELEEYGMNMVDSQAEDFVRYLDAGCSLAEEIAFRNKHRNCFRNILGMCSRTKSEILRPNYTENKIHTHGMPWAIKDFISAYLRLIKCWYILHGYIYAREGSLGSIEQEFNLDFKACYAMWEHNTREMIEHILRIFSTLDSNMQSSDMIYTPPGSSSGSSSGSSTSFFDYQCKPSRYKLVSPHVKVPLPPEGTGICMPSLHPSMVKRFQYPNADGIIYIKPANYNVAKKAGVAYPMPTIELCPTAANVSKHFQEIKESDLNEYNEDTDWLNVVTVAGVLMRKDMSTTGPKKFSITNKICANGDAGRIYPQLPSKEFALFEIMSALASINYVSTTDSYTVADKVVQVGSTHNMIHGALKGAKRPIYQFNDPLGLMLVKMVDDLVNSDVASVEDTEEDVSNKLLVSKGSENLMSTDLSDMAILGDVLRSDIDSETIMANEQANRAIEAGESADLSLRENSGNDEWVNSEDSDEDTMSHNTTDTVFMICHTASGQN